MRLLLRCLIFSAAFNLLLAVLILGTVGWPSNAAFTLLYPAFRLGAVLFRPILDSDSGPANGVGLILLSFPLNGVLCTGVLFFIFKVIYVKERRHSTQ
jgi:hypothetical protein